MSVLFIQTRAKLNLSLNVLGVLENNYHDLDMVICPISMHDEIILEKADKGIDFKCTNKVLENEDNLVYRAAQSILKYANINKGVKIHLNKRIWMQAGMGGGSSNAAGVLLGINQLYELNLSKDQLAEIAITLGADVPLFLSNGLTRVQGIGEQLQYYPFDTKLHIVALQGSEGLSTPDVFRFYDNNPCRKRVDNEMLIKAVQENNLEILSKNMHNCLQSSAIILNDTILQALDYLKKYGAINSMLTGSGSAVYGIFTDKKVSDEAVTKLKGEFKNCQYVTSKSEYITIRSI